MSFFGSLFVFILLYRRNVAIKACVMNENYLARAHICIYSPLASHYGAIVPQIIRRMKTRSTFIAVCWVGSNNNCSPENGKHLKLCYRNLRWCSWYLGWWSWYTIFGIFMVYFVLRIKRLIFGMTCLVFRVGIFDDGSPFW